MNKKIQSIVWISKDIPDSLIETIKEYKKVNQEEKMGWNLLISSNSRKEIEGISYIDKEHLCNKIITTTKDTVPEDVIEFALFSKNFLSQIDTIDTGTHRNAALLATVGQRIISSDDDVLCQFYQIKNNHRKLKVDQHDVKTFYFENKNLSELTIDYENGSNLIEIVKAHQNLLNSVIGDGDLKILATMTGVHGESIADTPYHLLSQRHYTKDESLYLHAKRNKLALSYCEDYIVRKKPRFVTMFSALNNEEILPPFFPIARNQDGVFAAAMMACLPKSVTGQIPWVAKHEHFPPRYYEEEDIYKYDFRIHSLLTSLLNLYTNLNHKKATDTSKNRYKEVGKFLENFANMSHEEYLKFMQNYITSNHDRITLRLGKFLVSNQGYSREWQKDIKKYLINVKNQTNSPQFCIPQELINETRTLEENVELTKELIRIYGQLLYYWPDIIESTKNNSN